jgi:aminomethyltransferase
LIPRRRREEKSYPGAARVSEEIASGPPRLRMGITMESMPDKEGDEIQSLEGQNIGKVTSAGFGHSVGAPIAMGYVDRAFAKAGTAVRLSTAGEVVAGALVELPFLPHRFYRG